MAFRRSIRSLLSLGAGRLCGGLCIGLILLGFIPTDRAKAIERRKVLIIYSYDDLIPWQALIRAGLQERLAQIDAASRPEIYEERVDSARIDVAVSGAALSSYLKAKYARLEFDTVITESSAATGILLANPGLFAHAQRLAIDPGTMEPAKNPENGIRVIKTQGEWAGKSLATIATVMPKLKQLIAIVDQSPVGDFNKGALRAAAAALPNAAKLDVWDSFTYEELLERSAHLPPDTAIFYSPVFKDRTGARQTPRALAEKLANTASAPIFAYHDTFMGAGIVGGRLLSSRRVGAMIADLALGHGYAEKWEGAEAEALLNPNMFDNAALERWGIGEDRLPVPNVITGRTESLWARYRWQIGSTFAALVLEGGLIVWLITALRQRKAAIQAVTIERDGLELRVLERTGELLAATRRLEESNMRLEHLASTDALTGVANRRKFLDVSQAALARTASHSGSVSILMLDIDKFKSINDHHGHAAGDQVIRCVAEACRLQVREVDCVGRMGGEEFAILLPEVDVAEAAVNAERIRRAIEGLRIDVTHDATLNLTVSIGVATSLDGSDTIGDIVARADRALYQAKRGGRNQVVVAGSAPPSERGPDPHLAYCA